MTRVPKIRTPGEIVVLVPHLVGFQPEESLVAISLRPPRGRVGLTLRADLVEDPVVVDQVVQPLFADGASACLLVVHTRQASDGVHPWRGLVDAIECQLAARGVEVMEALLVRDGRWWSYRCERPCCPASGTALDPGSDAVQAVATASAFAGHAVLASREELVASVGPVLPLGAAVAAQHQERAVTELAGRVLLDGTASVLEEVERWRAALEAWERRPDRLAPEVAAALAVGLRLIQVRDEVATWALERPEALLGLLLAACRSTVPPDDAAVCTLLAWMAYAGGNGALTRIALERALATDPDYSLARLILTALDAMLPPGQIRSTMRAALPGRRRPRGRGRRAA